MDINKKQLIDTLRYLAENDPVQLKEIIDAATNPKSNNLEDPTVAYQQDKLIEKPNISQFAEESFKRFDKVYKALS